MTTPVLDDTFAGEDFGQVHFGTADLGDRRRTRRLVRAANQIVRRPDETLPHKLNTPAELDAFYRLMNREETTHAAVLAPHRQRTLARMRQQDGVVLILHDGTELDYTSKQSLTELGQIGNGSRRGYLCHNSLAIAAGSREVLGLVNQILHKRVRVRGQESRATRRKRHNRESRLWCLGGEAIGAAPAAATWVHVADRGGDTFEALETFQRLGTFVVRSNVSRSIRCGHGATDSDGLLHDYAQSLPTLATRTVQVTSRPADRKGRTRRPAQPARTTRVRVAAATVLVKPPRCRRGEHGNQPLRLWVVAVRELEAPAGAQPLEWFLLTNHPVQSAADALGVVEWYEQRWTIEEYHKAMKTGCRIENPQFTTEAALQPTIALLSVVAAFLLNLRDLARRPDAHQRRAADVLDEQTVATLCRWRHAGHVSADWSVHDFVLALARLGGHQNRKSDGLPGWLTLWRGWQSLQDMLLAVNTRRHRSRCGET